jgi:putative hemolysin
MRDHKTSTAIVIDEYGGVEGLLTVNDVIEDLVDELGADDGSEEVERATRRDDGTWLLNGAFPAHEVRELFDIEELEGEQNGRFETIGGFILDQLGHIPRAGESVEADGHRVEVVDMDGHRIDKVLVTPPSSGGAADVASEDI